MGANLMPPISELELSIAWSLLSQATVLTEARDLSISFGDASGRFKSYIRKSFSKPPVSKRWASCRRLSLVTEQKLE